MSLINIKPSAGFSGISQINTTVASSVTATIDLNSLSDTASIKYVLTVINSTTGETRVTELLALPKSGNITYNKFGMLGDKIDFDIDIILNAGNAEFQFTNNELDTLNISLVKIITNK